jgi:alkylated DNA repair protein (DNA oxidative demethylase)
MVKKDVVTPGLPLAPGVTLWHEYFARPAQQSLVEAVMQRAQEVPFYRPLMPGSGKPFSVEETNFGELGWLSDKNGYRYVASHPATGAPWPAIPEALLELWAAVAGCPLAPQCCLVNLYRTGARMGLHQDRDEQALDAPVVSVSLGDEAQFRFGGTTRRGATQSVKLTSGDVLVFGGPARLMFHGIDRISAGSSTLVANGGRLNLTLRRVTSPAT